MTITTDTRRDQLVAATMPWALFGLADHLMSFDLPAPREVCVPGHAGEPITLYVLPEHAAAWARDGITVTHTSEEATDLGIRSTVSGVIAGPCLRVRIISTVPFDHEVCRAEDCERVLCFDDDHCDGVARRGCPHVGEILCDEHSLACVECRDDFRVGSGR